jgi:uncharacterized hydrophobic protein (TIGR00271 family)
MKPQPDEFLGDLILGKRLSSTAQVVSVGLIIALGLVFSLPGRAMALIGPASMAATLLIVVVVALTVLNILELLAGSSEYGGTYTLVYEALGPEVGFFAGWSILAGCITLTAVMIRVATSYIAGLLRVPGPLTIYVSLALLVIMVVIQLFRLTPRRDVRLQASLILTLGLIVLIVRAMLRADWQAETATTTFTSGGFLRAAGWGAVSFAIVEMILSSRRQIREASRRLPRGIFSALILLGLFLLSIQGMLPRPGSSLERSSSTFLADALGSGNMALLWIAYLTAILAAILAANACLVTGARQLNAMARQGALPRGLRSIRRPFKMPPFLFGLLFVLVAPLILWAPVSWLSDVGACLFLLAMVFVNIAAIRSRHTEPERRRSLTIPFFPLVPSVAIALSAALLIALPVWGIVGAGIWLVLGLAVFLVYGRAHLTEAQEGVLVFGRKTAREKAPDLYRILVPLSSGAERHLMLDLATALARQTGGEVVPLQIITIADPLAIEEGRRLASERNTLFQWSTRVAARSGVPTFPITRLSRSISEGIIETAAEEQCDLILLSWALGGTSSGTRMGKVLDPVVQNAACDVAVVAVHPERLRQGELSQEGEQDDGCSPNMRALRLSRILVPTAGGPHAPLATRLALLLARECEARTSVIYVAGAEASPADLALGRQRIQQTLDALREQLKALPGGEQGQDAEQEDLALDSQVVTAESVAEGIALAGAENDLVLIGASNESLIDQVLFGTVPEQVARLCPSPVLMVKRFQGLRRFWARRVWNALFGALPTLARAEQVEVYKSVRRGARADVDFFIMTGLSAVIATYGLLQDSGAVIIGAMLVAPLFTPILAFSLAIVQGDARLLWLAIEAALKGVFLAIGLAVLLTALSPLRTLTHEIAARTHPNLFDLAVALASGAAGAYAIARKDVAASLPGVAIAAALVPPLGVLGIGLAMGDPQIAMGSGLLFVTNLIAITLAGAVTLILLGFRPTRRGERAARLRFGLAASLVLLAVISIPLGIVFSRSVQESRIQQRIEQTLSQELDIAGEVELERFTFEEHDAKIVISATVLAYGPLDEIAVSQVTDRLAEVLVRPVDLRLTSIPVETIDTFSP